MSGGDPVVVFGAGAGGRRVATHLARTRSIRYLVDNDVAKQGTRVLDWDVLPPRALLDTPEVTVVIASLYADEIFEQLTEVGVPGHRIEVVSPDAIAGAGSDPFPTGCALLIVGALASLAATAWWIAR